MPQIARLPDAAQLRVYSTDARARNPGHPGERGELAASRAAAPQRGLNLELAVNLCSAWAMGLSIPPPRQLRADEVIE